MTQEEKNLLLQDLCGRLPYGVKVNHLLDTKPSDLFAIDTYRSTLYCFRNGREEWYKVEFIKPYLRPMSSMTEEERKKYNDLYYQVPIQRSDGNAYRDTKMVEALHIDWLNEKMFDFRGLIKKGLAIEVTPENNPYDILI